MLSSDKNMMISIIMPAYNSEKYIADAINSVLNQSYSNWELIIVDDGSTDGTAIIANEMQLKDTRIKVYHTENYGVAHARNVGLDNAMGEWIAFIDSDDIYTNDALEKLLEVSDEFDYVIGNYEEFGRNAKQHEAYEVSLKSKREIYRYALRDKAFLLFNTVWGSLLKKDTIKIRFDEDCQVGEDTAFLPRYVKNVNSIRIIGDVIYRYRRESEESLSYDVRRYPPTIRSKIFMSYRDYYGEYSPKMERLYNEYVWWSIHYVKGILADDSLTKREKSERALDTASTEFIKDMEKRNYRTDYRTIRRWIAIKTGDIDIIKGVFQEYEG